MVTFDIGNIILMIWFTFPLPATPFKFEIEPVILFVIIIQNFFFADLCSGNNRCVLKKQKEKQ